MAGLKARKGTSPGEEMDMKITKKKVCEGGYMLLKDGKDTGLRIYRDDTSKKWGQGVEWDLSSEDGWHLMSARGLNDVMARVERIVGAFQ